MRRRPETVAANQAVSRSAAAFFWLISSCRFPYFLSALQTRKRESKEVLLSELTPKVIAKLTSKNQLTLPKSVTEAIGPVEYFEVENKAGQIILTPVRIQRGDALRAKLAELKIDVKTIESAVDWAGEPAPRKARSAVTTKKTLTKPLSEPAKAPSVRRQKIEASPAQNLKASLSRVLAKAAKR